MASRRKTTPILIGVLGGLLTSVVIGNWQRSRPNVVMIVVDSMRGDAISEVIGSANTPNLRALIDEGVQFPNAFTHASETVAGHVALQSGTNPHLLGVAGSPREVHDGIPMLAETLRDHGYQTAAAVGLQDLWRPENGEGLARGFQRYEQGEHPLDSAPEVSRRLSAIMQGFDPNESFFLMANFADLHEPYQADIADAHHARILVDDRVIDEVVISQNSYWKHQLVLSPGEHLLELSSDIGIRVRNFDVRGPAGLMPMDLRAGELDGSSERIVMVLTNPSDDELTVEVDAWMHDSPSLQELRERYRSEIEAVDHAVGELITELKWRGLYDDTIIIVTSAHGAALGEHDVVGHEQNLFDEVLNVPLIVRLPQTWTEAALLIENTPEIVRLIDVAPTILELCQIPEWEGMTGESLLCEAKRPLLAQAVALDGTRTSFAMRDARYKLIFEPTPAGGEYQMFRLSADPLELDNVFGHQGHLRKNWQLELRRAASVLATN